MDEENNTPESAPTTETSPSLNNKKMMNPIVIAAVVIAIAVVGYFAFTMTNKIGQQDAQRAESESMSASEEADSGSVAMGDVLSVKVEGGSFYFKPNVIEAKLGQTVKVELTAVSLQHDFVIDALGVKVPVTPSGKSSTVEFTADTLGEFEFYCSVGNHRQQGMVGKLIVTQ